MRRVEGQGNPNARLLVLGEAPGANEESSGIPFNGPAGEILDKILDAAGSSRSEVYVTNVVKVRPPDNDLKKLELIGYRIEDFYPELDIEIKSLNPTCILALGNEALRAVTGNSGITKWRGSILRSKYAGIKVVPSIHPASLLYQRESAAGIGYEMKTIMQLDYKRAVDESIDREYNVPDRNLMVCNSSMQLFNFLRRHEDKLVAAIDIESMHCIPICIGIAFSPHEALSIPLIDVMSWYGERKIGDNDLNDVWRLLIEFFERPGLKLIGQNFKYDHTKLLAPCGFPVPDPYADTMLMAHTINPELPRSLAFLTSIYTREPYYKDEGREFNPKKDRLDRLLLYNAKDCVVTFEAYEEMSKDLDELGLTEFFYDFVMKLHPLYMHIESVGFKVDEEKRKELKIKYKGLIAKAEAEFHELSGYKPVSAAGLKLMQKECKATGNEMSNVVNLNSPLQVKALLEILGFPKRESTDEDTLVALIGNHCSKDEKKKRILENILDIRKYKKMENNYLSAKADYDGRMRTSYRIDGTKTGRTSTAIQEMPVRPEEMGAAFQTLTKHGDIGPEVREMYVPGY